MIVSTKCFLFKIVGSVKVNFPDNKSNKGTFEKS